MRDLRGLAEGPESLPTYGEGESRSTLTQGIDYCLPESVGGSRWQILHYQLRALAPEHRDLEQVDGRVSEVAGCRSRAVHLVERGELLAVGEPLPAQWYARAEEILRFRGPSFSAAEDQLVFRPFAPLLPQRPRARLCRARLALRLPRAPRAGRPPP